MALIHYYWIYRSGALQRHLTDHFLKLKLILFNNCETYELKVLIMLMFLSYVRFWSNLERRFLRNYFLMLFSYNILQLTILSKFSKVKNIFFFSEGSSAWTSFSPFWIPNYYFFIPNFTIFVENMLSSLCWNYRGKNYKIFNSKVANSFVWTRVRFSRYILVF